MASVKESNQDSGNHQSVFTPEYVVDTFRAYLNGRAYSADVLEQELFMLLDPDTVTADKKRMVKLATASEMLLSQYCAMTNIPYTPQMRRAVVLTGGMIDPYDGMLDSESPLASVHTGISLLKHFDPATSVLQTSFRPETENTQFLRLFGRYKERVSDRVFPGYWPVAAVMHMTQILSLLQRKDIQELAGVPLTPSDVAYISSVKGGVNALLYLGLADPSVADSVAKIDVHKSWNLQEVWDTYHTIESLVHLENQPFLRAIFTSGSFIQLVDDYEDRYTDKKAGIATSMTEDDSAAAGFFRLIPSYMGYISDLFLKAGIPPKKIDEFMASLWVYTARKVLKVKR